MAPVDWLVMSYHLFGDKIIQINDIIITNITLYSQVGHWRPVSGTYHTEQQLHSLYVHFLQQIG